MNGLRYHRAAARITTGAAPTRMGIASMGLGRISPSHWHRVAVLLITLLIAGAGWDQAEARSPRKDPPKRVVHGPNYRPPYAAIVVDDKSEVDHAYRLLLVRYPEYRVLPKPNRKEIAMVRVTPDLVSIVDYAKGYGHADLMRVTEDDLAEFVERRRHHWAGESAADHNPEPSISRIRRQ